MYSLSILLPSRFHNECVSPICMCVQRVMCCVLITPNSDRTTNSMNISTTRNSTAAVNCFSCPAPHATISVPKRRAKNTRSTPGWRPWFARTVATWRSERTMAEIAGGGWSSLQKAAESIG